MRLVINWKLNNLNPPHKGEFYFTLIVLIDIFNI